MAKYKANPRCDIVTFRTTAARKQALHEALEQEPKGTTMSELVDKLLSLYLEATAHDKPCVQ